MTYQNGSAPAAVNGRGAGQTNGRGLRNQYSAGGSGAYRGLIGPVARELCGDPNMKASNATELRFGTHGSLSVDLEKDTWYDHEADEGGGVLDLVTRCTGREDGKRWLLERGYLRDEVPRSASPAAVYDYADESGEILFQVERRDGRKFLQRKPDGTYNVRGVRQVPYRLPELVSRPDELVFIAEGEKDCDNLRAAGLLATCNAGGAGKWREHHAEFLRGRDVVILPDNDEPGRDHARKVRESLDGIARSVRVLELPGLPVKGDVSDWLAAGGTAEALAGMVEGTEQDANTTPPADLVRVDISDIMGAKLPPPGFVFDTIIPRRVVTLLGGHGGMGKSMLGLTLCAHAACGRPWGPFTVDPTPTAYVSLEDEADVVRYRLRRIIETYGLPADEVIGALSIFDGTDTEAALVTEVSEAGTRRLQRTAMLEQMTEAVAGAGLVMVDNASDAFDGDENNRRQVRTFVRYLAQIARGNDAGMVLLAHIDKNAARHGGKGNTYSGSTAWHNSARSRLALVEEEGALELLHEKAQFGPIAEPLPLSRAEYGVLVPGPIDGGAREAAADLMAKADADAVLEVVRLAVDAGITVPTATSGPWTAWHALEKLPELAPAYRVPAGKRRVAAALVRLGREGRIVRVEYRKPTRKPGERWEPAQIALKTAA